MQQGNKVKAGDNRSRLIIILVVVAMLAIVVVFSLPMVQIPVQVTETYYETEYQEERYTDTETYTVQTTGGSTGEKSKYIFYDYLVPLVFTLRT
jgi:flagellar basal body-associated protein FliL